MLVEDIGLADELRALILDGVQPNNAWRLGLSENGQVEWVNDGERRTTEPVRGPWQRIKQFLHTLLPIRDQA